MVNRDLSRFSAMIGTLRNKIDECDNYTTPVIVPTSLEDYISDYRWTSKYYTNDDGTVSIRYKIHKVGYIDNVSVEATNNGTFKLFVNGSEINVFASPDLLSEYLSNKVFSSDTDPAYVGEDTSLMKGAFSNNDPNVAMVLSYVFTNSSNDSPEMKKAWEKVSKDYFDIDSLVADLLAIGKANEMERSIEYVTAIIYRIAFNDGVSFNKIDNSLLELVGFSISRVSTLLSTLIDQVFMVGSSQEYDKDTMKNYIASILDMCGGSLIKAANYLTIAYLAANSTDVDTTVDDAVVQLKLLKEDVFSVEGK